MLQLQMSLWFPQCLLPILGPVYSSHNMFVVFHFIYINEYIDHVQFTVFCLFNVFTELQRSDQVQCVSEVFQRLTYTAVSCHSFMSLNQ